MPTYTQALPFMLLCLIMPNAKNVIFILAVAGKKGIHGSGTVDVKFVVIKMYKQISSAKTKRGILYTK